DLRVMETDTLLTGTISSRELTLPTDLVEPISLHLTTFGDQRWLRPFVAGAGPNMTYLTYDTIPTAWAINRTNIDLDSPCDQAHTFQFRYRQSFALSDGSPTNWLLTNHPDLYVAVCLTEAYQYQKNADAVALWEQRYRASLGEVQRKEAKSKSMATLVVDPGLRTRRGFDINTGGF
ncbi:MAG: hypothetical protein GY798_28645, partial [Hyphomicrobiales bacterium]|nr:hypothetical protein [Hyphomicrobiales bacterium]